MIGFIVQRVLLMIPTLVVVSIISFLIMQAPPGDYLTSYLANLSATGETVDQSEIDALRNRYGLDSWVFRPRILNDVSEVDVAAALLGETLRIRTGETGKDAV